MTAHGTCTRPRCIRELPCADGAEDRNDCPFWRPGEEVPEAASSRAAAGESSVGWTGRGLGTGDLELLAARGPLTILGILGSHDSGKTTLLARLWLMMLRGSTLLGGTFAGSLTLGGWEALAAPMRWAEDVLPGFPMHTTSEQTRIPSLLHLALRMPNEALRDVVFTDAPGEWFSAWSVRADDPRAAGATWIARRAAGFIVLADCARLAGPERGAARGQIRGLLERLGEHACGRPVTLVWSKSDVMVGPDMQATVRATLRRHLGHADEHATGIYDPGSTAGVFEGALRAELHAGRHAPWVAPIVELTPFGAYRGGLR